MENIEEIGKPKVKDLPPLPEPPSEAYLKSLLPKIPILPNITTISMNEMKKQLRTLVENKLEELYSIPGLDEKSAKIIMEWKKNYECAQDSINDRLSTQLLTKTIAGVGTDISATSVTGGPVTITPVP